MPPLDDNGPTGSDSGQRCRERPRNLHDSASSEPYITCMTLIGAPDGVVMTRKHLDVQTERYLAVNRARNPCMPLPA